MVDCSGLENPSEDSPKTAGIAENCDSGDAQDALFTERSADCDGSNVGTVFPEPDDWGAWVDIWCRDDTGNINCVPPCLSHYVQHLVTPEGWLRQPDSIPNTPYKIARWFHLNRIGAERPPWIGFGIRPHQAKEIWEEKLEEWRREDEPAPDEPQHADLYFIGGDEGPIKIGVSNDPQRRLKGLQTGYPYPLQILATIEGGAMLEIEYHERFAEHRLHGEWFAPHPDILAEIERLRTHPNTEGN